MVVGHMQGEPKEKVLTWAEFEVEGFMRTWNHARARG